jgi:amino acid transporter
VAAGGAFVLGLPYLWNNTAYAAVTSIAVIGLYIAYVLPTFLRLRQGDDFVRGPWHLGRWSKLIGTVAVVWVCFITILFMLPQASPVTATTFNYTPVAVLVVLGFAGIWWVASARRWFTGPKVQGTPEELAAIERDLDVI